MHPDNVWDNLIRSSLHAEASELEPSAAVRKGLLAQAADTRLRQLPVQESIPPLVKNLEDTEEQPETVHWWEAERSLFENFALWDNPWRNPSLAHVLLYQETSRCRIKGAAC
jgi:hypothetical protein